MLDYWLHSVAVLADTVKIVSTMQPFCYTV